MWFYRIPDWRVKAPSQAGIRKEKCILTALTKETNMPKAPLKLPAKEAADSETASQPDTEAVSTPNTPAIPEARAQRRTTEAGRYWLQIDRQTKSSYDTAEAAATAGTSDQEAILDGPGRRLRPQGRLEPNSGASGLAPFLFRDGNDK